RKTQEHRDVLRLPLEWRMPAPVLEVAALAAARVEQRPQPIRGLCGAGRADPDLAEQRVAQLELLFLLEAEIGEEMGKGVGVDCPRRRALAGRAVLEILRPGEVAGGRGDGPHPRQI